MKVKDHGEVALFNYIHLRVIVSDSVSSQESPMFRNASEFLANESMAVALAVLLAVILVLISVCTVLVWLMGLRRKQTAGKALQQGERHNNGSLNLMHFI